MSNEVERIVQQTEALLRLRHEETLQETTPQRLHECLGEVIMMQINDSWVKTKKRQTAGRRAFYFSAEYLVGRLVYSNLFNLGILSEVKKAFAEKGVDLACLEEIEDAALGNGGLGRLAACYMDSMSTLGLEATGYSICYELGIFKQKFTNGKQTEVADDWRIAAESWLVPRYEDAVEVRFGGQVSPHWDNFGHYTAEYTGYTAVIAVPRDMLIAGYGGKEINYLRLWDAKSPNSLDMYLFSEGEYVKSMEQRTMAEVITKVLYPADEHIEGKTLRLKQQYFFVLSLIHI